jgi:hypothetical protein
MTVMRFSELERAIPVVSQKMLIQQLRELERDGIVQRAIHPQVPPKVEYKPTTVGKALRPALRALLAWQPYGKGLSSMGSEASPFLSIHQTRSSKNMPGGYLVSRATVESLESRRRRIGVYAGSSTFEPFAT